MDDLGSIVVQLRRLVETVNDVSRTLDQAASWITGALDDVDSLDDPGARMARDLMCSAHDDVYGVIFGWLNYFQRRAEELVKRLQQ
jgi:hypothetical protein